MLHLSDPGKLLMVVVIDECLKVGASDLVRRPHPIRASGRSQ